MPIFTINNQKVLFVHIPKTAGATLESHLRTLTKLGLFSGDFKKRRELKLPSSPQHFHLAILRSMFPFDFFDWQFTIVRNPLDRIKSEYRMRKGLLADKFLAFPDWVNGVFEDYAINPYVFDNHIRPQVEFVGNGVEVLRFEEGLQQVLNRLSSRLGIPEMVCGQIHKQKHPPIAIDCPADCTEAINKFYQADFETFRY